MLPEGTSSIMAGSMQETQVPSPVRKHAGLSFDPSDSTHALSMSNGGNGWNF